MGAGLAGIGAAYQLQTQCPEKTYLILEGREQLGGTWDQFRYPGIRSDSDMYTYSYSARPWKSPKVFADGPSILAYIRETAEAEGIDQKIRYRHRVERARWSSDDARWTIEARDLATGEPAVFTCSFFYVCAGYYDHAEGYTPPFPGRERFRGRIVHPQHWTPDIDYDGKRVVVIGSGATAVTLVPELAPHLPDEEALRPLRRAAAELVEAHPEQQVLPAGGGVRRALREVRTQKFGDRVAARPRGHVRRRSLQHRHVCRALRELRDERHRGGAA
ncbi:MAG TPA: NAD(P)/FAD-dependent oxidoreductase, partial [Kofleriaceae bacterium]|nr:NAD(P)/FAD-dependent oxidoreductase [Kofleriaceae bacterium]